MTCSTTSRTTVTVNKLFTYRFVYKNNILYFLQSYINSISVIYYSLQDNVNSTMTVVIEGIIRVFLFYCSLQDKVNTTMNVVIEGIIQQEK